MIFANALLDAALVFTILGTLVGGILIGMGLLYLIIKLRNRNKKVKINSKTSDYQFQFRLNTGQFLNDIKNGKKE